jgi:hypothetical protein
LPTDALITADPPAMALTLPLLTVATDLSLEDHLTSEPDPDSFNLYVSPTLSVIFDLFNFVAALTVCIGAREIINDSTNNKLIIFFIGSIPFVLYSVIIYQLA